MKRGLGTRPRVFSERCYVVTPRTARVYTCVARVTKATPAPPPLKGILQKVIYNYPKGFRIILEDLLLILIITQGYAQDLGERGCASLKELNLCFNIMNVKLCLLNQEIWSH